MEQLVALIAFSFVSSVTPGPNNVLLWASGAQFGIRATGRHILGTAAGLGAMALAVTAGVGVLVTSIPSLAVAMKLVGSAYLLYLAYRIVGSHSLERGSLARPLGFTRAAMFQVINPKAWIFALGAVTTFRPGGLPVTAGGLLVAAVMMIVILPSASLWAVAGDGLGRLVADDRARRVINIGLATAVAATVGLVWI